MKNNALKISLQTVMCAVSVLLNLIGILSLLYVNKLADIGFLHFYDNMRLIVKYVVIIVFMASGIMLFNAFAGTFKGKTKNVLSISVCAYSTVLTIPLLLVFLGCFFAVNGIELPMVGEIAAEFQDIFKNTGVQYLMFVLGTLMSLIFLAVPILMCVLTVKDLKPADLFKRKKKPAPKDDKTE